MAEAAPDTKADASTTDPGQYGTAECSGPCATSPSDEQVVVGGESVSARSTEVASDVAISDTTALGRTV